MGQSPEAEPEGFCLDILLTLITWKSLRFWFKECTHILYDQEGGQQGSEEGDLGWKVLAHLRSNLKKKKQTKKHACHF